MRVDPIIIVAFLGMVALVMTPFILAEGRDLFKEFRDAFFQDWGNGNGDTTGTSGATLTLKIVGADGSVQEYENPSPLIPYMIPVDGGIQDPVALDRVECDFSFTVEYEGTQQSWTLDLTFSVAIFHGDGRLYDSFGSWGKQFSGGQSWPSGDSLFYIASRNPAFSKQTVKATEIESLMVSAPDGHYQLRFNLYADLKMTFRDGTTDSKSGEVTGAYGFEWDVDAEQQGRIKSLTITIDASPW